MSAQTPTVVQVSLLDYTGDSFHRMRWPGVQLSRHAPNWRVINLDFRAIERFSWGVEADLLVLLHCGDIDLLPLILKRRSLGKKTLIEINDNFYSPQAWNPAKRNWLSPLVWKMYEQMIDAADGVIVTGPGLCELLKPRAEGKIFILENHFPEELKDFPAPKRKAKSEFALGWAGSAGHMADLLFVAPVLRQLLSENPHVNFHLMGDESTPSFLRLPESRLRFTPFGPMDAYFRFWENVDLGFVPLLDTPYNRCRSDIKAVEIAGKGILPILQRGLPYEKFIRETQAPCFEKLSDFKIIVQRYLNDSDLLRSDAERCFSYVARDRVGLRRRERFELYQKFLEQSPPNNFSWNLPAGFHELNGTHSKQTATQASLERVQNLWAQRKSHEAILFLQGEVEKNPFNAELAFAELRCLEAVQSKNLKSELARFCDAFSEDLRFALFDLRLTSNQVDRVKKWSDVLRKVQATSENLRDHYRASILTQFIPELSNDETILRLAEDMVQVYPLAFEFRYKLALTLEAAGKNKAAAEHFRWLAQRKREFDDGRSFLDQTPDYVLEVWDATMASRLNDEKSI